jgi:hypothetical protein
MMRSLSRLASLLSLLSAAAVMTRASPLDLNDRAADASCTLSASGGDDAPSFVTAVQSCSTVIIPASTTLNISSKMNMTGLSNKLIVCADILKLLLLKCTECVFRPCQNLEGAIKINDNIKYWAGVC